LAWRRRRRRAKPAVAHVSLLPPELASDRERLRALERRLAHDGLGRDRRIGKRAGRERGRHEGSEDTRAIAAILVIPSRRATIDHPPWWWRCGLL
jgi:hypothetical protein